MRLKFLNPKGFTLVELLVVIAIIALLAALAIPAIGRSIAQSQAATCSGNMRQLGAGIMAYAAENDGYLPQAKYSPNGREWFTTSDGIAGYIGYTNAGGGSLLTRGKVFVCPGAKKKGTEEDPNNGSYMPNQSVMPMINSPGERIKLVSINKPASTVLLMEGYHAAAVTMPDRWSKFAAGWNGPGRLRHGAQGPGVSDVRLAKKGYGMNILFADGHVEFRSLLRDPMASDWLINDSTASRSPEPLFGNGIKYAPAAD